MNAFIGLDPGSSSGAWGVIDERLNYVDCGDIVSNNGRIDVVFLCAILAKYKHDFQNLYIAMEEVGVRPGQGIASSGKFMRAAGSIEAVAALTGDSFVLVRPQVWKKSHALLNTDKKASLELARHIWPDADLRLVKHHGRADALLIALWLAHDYNESS